MKTYVKSNQQFKTKIRMPLISKINSETKKKPTNMRRYHTSVEEKHHALHTRIH